MTRRGQLQQSSLSRGTLRPRAPRQPQRAAPHRPQPPAGSGRSARLPQPRERLQTKPGHPGCSRGAMSTPLGTAPPPAPQVRRGRLRPSGGGRPTPPSCGPGEPRWMEKRAKSPLGKGERRRLSPGSRRVGRGECPAAPRQGLKSLTPPAPPSVLSAHWPVPAPPTPAPADFIGPFESGSSYACSAPLGGGYWALPAPRGERPGMGVVPARSCRLARSARAPLERDREGGRCARPHRGAEGRLGPLGSPRGPAEGGGRRPKAAVLGRRTRPLFPKGSSSSELKLMVVLLGQGEQRNKKEKGLLAAFSFQEQIGPSLL